MAMDKLHLYSFVLVAAAMAAHGAHAADSFPDRPIRILQGFSAGGISDTLARLVGDQMQRTLGQPIIVETRPGGGGIVAMTAVTGATPDGHTLLLGNSAITISPNRREKLPFDPMKAFIPVSMIGTSPSVLVANPAFGPKSVPELITYAKSHKGKVDCATSGVGTSNDLAVHLMNTMSAISLTPVRYKGSGPSLTAAVANETPLSFAPLLAAIPHVKQGRLRALGMSSAKRNPALPDVPAISESIPGYEAVGFYSIVAPRGVPAARVKKLHDAINAALGIPEVRKRMESYGVDVTVMTREQFADFMRKDAEKWKKLVHDAQLAL
ncbi:MAG TPA: tripartite tricarboxylate transporter substrate binding protein [Burkholderiales bacterium]|nr:tripartite tricarboxylate transporter substrate binding protein [Burkholderiales bacterium]